MKIYEILDLLKKNVPQPLTVEIAENLKNLKQICDWQFSNQSYYGNAALNRQMLLDAEITKLLTPEVISYLFTHEPTPETTIVRNSTPGGISLRDAIYFGFKDGLHVLKYMPNNEHTYGPAGYQEQAEKFNSNTSTIVSNIQKAANIATLDDDSNELYQFSLKEKFEHIVRTVDLLKTNNKSDQLLFVPGYTPDDMRSQVQSGFHKICNILNVDLKNESLNSFCEKFLHSPEALLDGTVIHLFYDRAHIAAALEQNTPINIGGQTYTFQDIFRKMIEKISAQPDSYPSCAKEQFYLRFLLMESDLKKRFTDEFNKTLAILSPAAPVEKVNQIEQPIKLNVGNIEKSALIDAAKKLAQGFLNVKILLRIEDYRNGDEQHNSNQHVESVQFEFKSNQDLELFCNKIQQVDAAGIKFVGWGRSGQPILQLKADSILLQTKPVLNEKSSAELAQIAILDKANELGKSFNSTKTFLRIENYRNGDERHNSNQQVESVQFEFKSNQDLELFRNKIQQDDAAGIKFVGRGRSGQPILQLNADSILLQTKPVLNEKSSAELAQIAILDKANELGKSFNSTKTFLRIENYRNGDERHNSNQQVESVQFEFKSNQDLELFRNKIQQVDAAGIKFVGWGLSGQPILQLNADSILLQTKPGFDRNRFFSAAVEKTINSPSDQATFRVH